MAVGVVKPRRIEIQLEGDPIIPFRCFQFLPRAHEKLRPLIRHVETDAARYAADLFRPIAKRGSFPHSHLHVRKGTLVCKRFDLFRRGRRFDGKFVRNTRFVPQTVGRSQAVNVTARLRGDKRAVFRLPLALRAALGVKQCGVHLHLARKRTVRNIGRQAEFPVRFKGILRRVIGKIQRGGDVAFHRQRNRAFRHDLPARTGGVDDRISAEIGDVESIAEHGDPAAGGVFHRGGNFVNVALPVRNRIEIERVHAAERNFFRFILEPLDLDAAPREKRSARRDQA